METESIQPTEVATPISMAENPNGKRVSEHKSTNILTKRPRGAPGIEWALMSVDDRISTARSEDWPNDFKTAHGNCVGTCTFCNRIFIGMKQRPMCYICASKYPKVH